MFEGIDTVVLYDELAYQDVLPVEWRVLPGAIDQALAASFTERNVRVLQAYAAIEERAPAKPEGPETELQRLDHKVDLLLDLVGQLAAAQRPRPDPVPIRFNARGAVWRGGAPLPESGAQGIAEIHLRNFTVEPLRLVGRIADVTAEGNVKARFSPIAPLAAALIEKLILRHHRRQIARSRLPIRR